MKRANFIAIIVILAMLTGLCGCGGDNAAGTSVSAYDSTSGKASEVLDTSDAESGNASGGASAERNTSDAGAENYNTSSADSEPEYVTLTDMVGREISILPASYSRVVCIGAGALRMYSYVGDISLLCGVEDIDNLSLNDRPKMFDSVARPYVLAYGDAYSQLPSCGVGGPNAQTAEAEKILSCNPDIIISCYEDASKAEALQEQVGVPVITLSIGSGGVTDEAFSGSLMLLGQIFGTESRAEEIIDFVQSEINEISARTADIADADKPSVYICGLGNWGTTTHLYTSMNYAPFEIANVKNAITGLSAPGIQPLEEEKFVAIGETCDIMIIDAAAVKNIIPLYQEDSTIFDTCKAWQTGEVYLEMPYNAYYTNFETDLANTWFIAKTVYPELFSDIDMTAKTNEITEMFLGTALADEIFACGYSYGGYQKVEAELMS